MSTTATRLPPPKRRPVYGTENSWCRAVPGGTGVTVLSLLLKTPPDLSLLQTALHKLQHDHPILRAKLHHHPTFSLLIPNSSSLLLQSHDRQSTAQIIRERGDSLDLVSPFQIILEHEMNNNPWANPDPSSPPSSPSDGVNVMHASAYELEGEWTVLVKLHTGACDRTAAVQVMRELMEMMKNGGDEEREGEEEEEEEEGEVNLGIEEYVPSEKTSKPFWSRGVNMLGYSLNSFRLSNLEFADPGSQRCSRVVRLMLDSHHTSSLLEGCKSRGIKLCGALSAAGLIAARLSKGLSDGEWEKYAVVTLIDCRKLLEPPLSNHHVGFFHAGILNTHDMQGGEELWELARRTFKSFDDAKNSNKHFSDMADLNFLMCRAIENPGLTPSSALRTSFISVFEDPVVDETSENYSELGIKDYMGCASVHGVGPSVAIFDTIRDGKLDCACVYPFPVHSREQMQELIDNMKKILIHSCSSENEC